MKIDSRHSALSVAIVASLASLVATPAAQAQVSALMLEEVMSAPEKGRKICRMLAFPSAP